MIPPCFIFKLFLPSDIIPRFVLYAYEKKRAEPRFETQNRHVKPPRNKRIKYNIALVLNKQVEKSLPEQAR